MQLWRWVLSNSNQHSVCQVSSSHTGAWWWQDTRQAYIRQGAGGAMEQQRQQRRHDISTAIKIENSTRCKVQ